MHQRFENLVTALFLLVLGAGLLLHEGEFPGCRLLLTAGDSAFPASVVGSARHCPHRPKPMGLLRQYSQEVFSGDHRPLPLAHPQLFQPGKKGRDFPAVLQALGPFVSRSEELAEVKATGYVLHTHDIRHMGGMPGQHLRRLLLRIGVDKSMVDVHPHHTTGVPDGPELIVRQVPPDIAQSAAVGVRCNHRPSG